MSEERRTVKKKKLTAAQKRKLRIKRRVKKFFWRFGVVFITILVLLVGALLTAGYVVFKGPSQTFADLAAVTMEETSALKFVPRIYYTDEEMEALFARNQIVPLDEDVDDSLIVIQPVTASVSDEEGESQEEKDIELIELTGATYKGYLLIVKDPSRVSVGTCADQFSGKAGLKLDKIAKRYKAVAAINGGGFEDSGGGGNGGKPDGIVISHGNAMYKSSYDDHNVVIGFTKDDKLVIGKYNIDQCKKKKIRDAVSFGPALVLNGEPCKVSGVGSGLNPRTAIGQRADGAVLMLVIDGRSSSSAGATFSDVIDIMMEYGAVNAGNLDGGSSSMLYYNGEYVNRGVVLTGSRNLPDAFIVN